MGIRGEGRGKENKRYEDYWVAGVKVEEKQIKGYDFFFGRIRGQTRFEGKIATVPWQRYQKCLLVFLNIHRLIRKRTEIPL